MTEHLYVHIPYCRRVCPYCDFVCSSPDKLPPSEQYVRAVLRDLDAVEGRFETIYMGGGTPTELPIRDLDRLLAGLAARRRENCEWSIEGNPESFTSETAALLRQRGVNRLSLGFQSASDEVLKKLGRSHRHADNIRALDFAREAGFTNISGDLIFGLPEDHLAETISFFAERKLTHVSAYELTIEGESTWSLRKFDPSAGEDEKFAQLSRVVPLLEFAGFLRYEVSNFARSGFECRSHLNVWHAGEYAGIGAGAHGHENGIRYANTESSSEFLSGPHRTVDAIENLAAETMLLVSRLPQGIAITDLPPHRRSALANRHTELAALRDDGFIELTETIIRPTAKGLLFVNEIGLRMA
ncbi:MAG: radical SAM family heme chaperone HemW [Candidatus Hydrogenedentota bacterium]